MRCNVQPMATNNWCPDKTGNDKPKTAMCFSLPNKVKNRVRVRVRM